MNNTRVLLYGTVWYITIPYYTARCLGTPDQNGQGLFHLAIDIELLPVIGYRVNRDIQIGRKVAGRRFHH